MPGRPAARILDPVVHPLPGMLTPGPGSPNVIIGGKLAWRGVPAGAAAAIASAKATSDAAIKTAEAATLAAAGTPGAPAAKTAEEGVKAAAATAMGATITGMAGGADIHACTTPLPIPPHGPGVVIDGSPTVLTNGLPQCRQGDTILEAVGPPDKILMGMPTVLVGDAPSFSSQVDAARAALNFANPQSIAANQEFGGFIYQNPDGTFSFTFAGGTDAGFRLSDAPVPAGATEVGFFHCHGDYSVQDPATGRAIRTSDPARDDYNSDNFSRTDRNTAASRAAASSNPAGYRSYLGTPSGNFRVDDPNQPAASRVSNF